MCARSDGIHIEEGDNNVKAPDYCLDANVIFVRQNTLLFEKAADLICSVCVLCKYRWQCYINCLRLYADCIPNVNKHSISRVFKKLFCLTEHITLYNEITKNSVHIRGRQSKEKEEQDTRK